MSSTPPIRVHNQELSLWQSVVSNYALKQRTQLANRRKETLLTASRIQDDDMIKAVNVHVQNAFVEIYSHEVPLPQLIHPEANQENQNVFLSALCFNIARAKVREDDELERSLLETYRKYSDKDPGFLGCVETYLSYYTKYGGVLKYNSWQDAGNINYGVIDYRVPNNAKIAILGDWGTGMPDAEYLLSSLMATQKPDIIIHLGDIYYSGTPEECVDNFSGVFDRVFQKYGKRVPVFTIPGNHDYYAFAYGYYDMVTKLNSFLPSAVQNASYFCLRTEDDGWQFLGMDTGYDDASPVNQINTYYAGPKLVPSEIQWHKDKLHNFSGATLLLSHHQLFSGNSKINGSLSVYGSYPYLNKYLLDVFSPYFGNKVAGWLWGHEHNQVIFNNNLFGLPKGRLVGSSAFEEATSEDPYALKYPSVPFQNYRLDASNGYFNHSFAIIDLSQRQNPTDAVTISYYQYPSWGDVTPNPVPTQPQFMLSENIALSPKIRGRAVHYGQEVNINLENGLDFISSVDKGAQNYPTVGQTAIKLKILGGNGVIKDGDLLQIESQEQGISPYNLLGAWSTPALYYYKPGWKQEFWYIKKAIPSSDSTIYETDAVYFVNQYYPGQYLCPLIQTLYPNTTSLTTSAEIPANWYLRIV